MNPKKIFLLFAMIFWIGNLSAQKNEKLNFIFILTDDHNFDLLGFTGNKLIQTPEIDRLATEGVFFNNAHVTSAICTPSRVSMFLSQYERKHGVNFNSGTSIAPEAWANSYPMVMRRAGYYTGYIGKNHAPVGKGGYLSGVIEKSFDYWYAGHGHLGFYPKKRHDIFLEAKKDTQVEVIEEGALDFLGSNEYRLKKALHFLDSRPKDKPFCLSICFNLPHGAGTSTMKLLPSDSAIYRTLYRDQDIPMPDHYVAKADITNPKLPKELLHAADRQTSYDYVDTPETNRERIIRQMEAVTGIDGLVGNVRKALKASGLDKNTIIIFSSDHGLFMGQYGLGGKALCYEQTTHIPMIIYNPLLKKKHRAFISDALVQSIDIAPTMLALADIEIPESFQGKDLSGLLTGEKDKVRDILFTENLWSTHFGNPRCEAVQGKKWKYIRYYRNDNPSARAKIKLAKQLGMKVNDLLYGVHDSDMALYRKFSEAPWHGEQPVYEELYNLADDPQETTNLVENPAYKAELVRLRQAWRTAIDYARGDGVPKVLRYTEDSMKDQYGILKHE